MSILEQCVLEIHFLFFLYKFIKVPLKYELVMYDFISFVPTDPLYAVFHDEEWGVPVHDDKYVTSTILNSYC